VELSAAELDRLVAASLPKVGRVRALEPLQRGISGRIRRLRVRGESASAEVAGDLAIRRLLGGLRSSLFTVATKGSRARPDAFVVRGAGFGHGVGMCQLGAIGMADKRMKYVAILRHYFAGGRLHRLY
jgi:SpoIID/LytB domain protein